MRTSTAGTLANTWPALFFLLLLAAEHESWLHLSRLERASESPVNVPVHADTCLVRWPECDSELSKCSLPTLGHWHGKNPKNAHHWSLGLLGLVSSAAWFKIRIGKCSWRCHGWRQWVDKSTADTWHIFQDERVGYGVGGLRDLLPLHHLSFLAKRYQKSQRWKRESIFCLKKP